MKRQKKSRKLRLVIAILLLLVMIPAVFTGWRDLWKIFLETGLPTIEAVEFPNGIGVTARKYKFKVMDEGAGLAGIVVRVLQRGRAIDVYKKEFTRAPSAEVEFDLSAEQIKLTEGSAELEFRAYDASFWNNTELKEFLIQVDQRKPFVQVLSTQHNIRRTGSQMVIYEAVDDNLTVHGVKVGSKSYLGVPMRSLDASFVGTKIYAAFFTVTIDDPEAPIIKVFAEDAVGNGSSASFYYKILPAPAKLETVKLTSSYLHSVVGPLYKENYSLIKNWAIQSGEEVPAELTEDNEEKLQQAFLDLHKFLLPWSDLELRKHFKNPRSERLWQEAFQQPFGVALSAYGKQQIVNNKGDVLLQRFQSGYEIRGNSEVNAGNSGIVAFTDNVGSYGKVVGIDHGAGLFSVYAWLKSVDVTVGEAVSMGQVIGRSGDSGLSKGVDYFYQLRLYDTPVNPIEWWDSSWYLGHIVDKVNDVKRKLGLTVLVGQLAEP